MNELAPDCRCDHPEASNGLDHEKWCPYATWYVRGLYARQQAAAMTQELRDAAFRFLRATGDAGDS